MFVSAGLSLALSLTESAAPLMGHGLTRGDYALPLQLAVAVAAVTALAALWLRRYHLARVAAAAQVTLILGGWALSQFPYLVPPDLTLGTAAAPAATISLVLIALALGAVILIPSLWCLFRVFKSRSPAS